MIMRTAARVSLAALVLAVPLALAPTATSAFDRASGHRKAFRWEVKLKSCGQYEGPRSRALAKLRWRTSPGRGYMSGTFIRQLRDEASGRWRGAGRGTLTTEDTSLEGTRLRVRMDKWFEVEADEVGRTSRFVVRLRWVRERPGRDRLVFFRAVRLRSCVVGG